MPYFSLIIPVYNRPQEVGELLESLAEQTEQDFEVIIVEDGSSVKCEEVVKSFAATLDVKYFYKPNSGRSQTRNYGMERATGKYLVFYRLLGDTVVIYHIAHGASDYPKLLKTAFFS